MTARDQGQSSEAPAGRARDRTLWMRTMWMGTGTRWLGLAALLVLGAYLATGVYVVDTDEEAVVRRFGAPVAEVGPGMHYRLPWPVDQVDVLKTTSVMKTGVGFVLRGDSEDAIDGMEVLTGDTNILSIALALQYVIQDPTDFLFGTESAEALIGGIAEAALTETVLSMPVDEVLTTGRLAIQDQVKRATQARLDEYHSGVRITSSNIMTITLDKSVAEAFQEVTDAMADREKSRNEARMYANNLIPKTRGEAHALVREAQGFRQERVAQAVGNTSRFLALLQEYRKAPEITQARLYLEAMEEILPEVTMYVIDSEEGQVPVNLRVGAP
jgi:modulator of FtsH protease HflK